MSEPSRLMKGLRSCPGNVINRSAGAWVNTHGNKSFRLIVLLILTLFTEAGWSADNNISFDIPASPAHRGLNLFAKQADTQILYPYDRVKNLQVNSLHGEFTLEEGMRKLIEGTCLQLSNRTENSLTLDLNKNRRGFWFMKNNTNDCTRKGIMSAISAAVLSGLAATSATGQEPLSQPGASVLEEVVVTARRREERLQDVPIAISAFNGAELQRMGINNAEDLRMVSPGLNVSASPFGSSVPGYTLRGQRQLEAIATQDPSVVVYYADTPLMRPHGTNAAFFDIENVQVLKGPQGTLFGRNTTGGAILVNPRRPHMDGIDGETGITLGDYNLRSWDGAVNLPLTENFALRVGGKIIDRDGYTKNLYDGGKLDDEDSKNFRLSALWTPKENLEIFTTFQQFKLDNAGQSWRILQVNPAGAIAGAFPATFQTHLQDFQTLQGKDWHTVINDADMREKVDTWNISNSISWDISDITLKSIIGYRKVKTDIGFDYDGSNATFFTPAAGVVSVFNSENEIDGDQFSVELQALGQAINDRLDWIVGAFYFEEEVWDIQRSELFGRRHNAGTGKNESRSLFAQGSYALTDKVSLTAGYRHTWDDRELESENKLQGLAEPALRCRLVNGSGQPLNPCVRNSEIDENAGTWLVSIDYSPAEDILLYAAHRHGYRSGGLQLRANTPADPVTFEPEFVDDLEIGFKALTTIGSVPSKLNASLFYQEYEDIQRTLSFLPQGSNVLATAVLNAGNAVIKGAEIEWTIMPTDRLEIGAFVGYTDAEYKKFDNPGIAGQPASLKDNEFAFVPKTTAGATISYLLIASDEIGEISLRGNWYKQGKMEITDINDPGGVVEGYDVYNMFIDWESVAGSAFDSRLFVKNVGDEEYSTAGVSVWSTGVSVVNLGAPRTYGMELRYRF